MPLPAVLAVPAILSGIASGIMGFITSTIKAYGRKLATIALFSAAYVLALVTFVATLNSRFSELVVSLPNDSFLLAGLSLVPNNAVTCATIVVSAKASQMLFYFAIAFVKGKLKAN